jgi:hypothetical protein
MSAQPEPAGAFPLLGPLPYLHLSLEAARAALGAGPYPSETTWFHVTYDPVLPMILRTGLVPACWWGGDTCAIFGIDALEKVPTWRRHDWIIEIHSPALPGQVKAWWVPSSAIRGAWRHGIFYPADALPSPASARPPSLNRGCECEFASLVGEQQQRWHGSWR